MNKIITIAVLAISIIGCSTSADRAKKHARADHARCAQAGYQIGTADYEHCRTILHADREDRRRQALMMYYATQGQQMQSMGNTMMGYGLGYQPQQAAPIAPPPGPTWYYPGPNDTMWAQ